MHLRRHRVDGKGTILLQGTDFALVSALRLACLSERLITLQRVFEVDSYNSPVKVSLDLVPYLDVAKLLKGHLLEPDSLFLEGLQLSILLLLVVNDDRLHASQESNFFDIVFGNILPH